jgi:Ni/Co efflux regulator RcnB
MPRRNPLRIVAFGACVAGAIALHGAPARAEESHKPDHDVTVKRHPDTPGHARLTRPAAPEARPKTVDRNRYEHNFQARHAYGIGPYHPPAGFTYQRWHHGEVLPAAFWASSYVLADYGLFGLDVPPVGFEWIRYGPDAVLVDMRTGEILQIVYRTFV